MAGNKLVDEIKTEIGRYLGIPYAKNVWTQVGVIKEEAVFGGKGSIEEIEYATFCAAEKEGLRVDNMGKEEIYKLRKRNSIGIDCSGLVYRLLDKLDKIKGGQGILFKVLGVDRPFGIIGVRALSARELTHEQNSVKIEAVDEVETGDMIRMDEGSHVMFIVEKNEKEIVYAHSSDRTESGGVHCSKIVFEDVNLPLEKMKWLELLTDGSSYSTKYFPEKGDGVFRLKVWLK